MAKALANFPPSIIPVAQVLWQKTSRSYDRVTSIIVVHNNFASSFRCVRGDVI